MGTVFAGTGTVWEIHTCGIPVPNPKKAQNEGAEVTREEPAGLNLKFKAQSVIDHQMVGNQLIAHRLFLKQNPLKSS